MTSSRTQNNESKELKINIKHVFSNPVITSITSMNDGTVICGYSDGEIRFFNINLQKYRAPITGYYTVENTFKYFEEVHALVTLNNNKFINIQTTGEMYIHDLHNDKSLIKLEHNPSNDFELFITLKNKNLIAAAECGNEQTIKVWNDNGLLLDIDFPKGNGPIIPASSPEGNLIFSVHLSTKPDGSESQLYIWNPDTNELQTSIKVPGYISDISPISEELVVVKIGYNNLTLIDLKNQQILDTMLHTENFFGDSLVLPNGFIIYSKFPNPSMMTIFKIENSLITKHHEHNARCDIKKIHLLSDGNIIYINEDDCIVQLEIPTVTNEIENENAFIKARQEALAPYLPKVVRDTIIKYDTTYDINRFFSRLPTTPKDHTEPPRQRGLSII